MNRTQKKLLAAIKKNPDSSIRDLQVACGISSASLANYHLMKMEAAGVIQRVRWQIVEKE